jgi:hypothetical protein
MSVKELVANSKIASIKAQQHPHLPYTSCHIFPNRSRLPEHSSRIVFATYDAYFGVNTPNLYYILPVNLDATPVDTSPAWKALGGTTAKSNQAKLLCFAGNYLFGVPNDRTGIDSHDFVLAWDVVNGSSQLHSLSPALSKVSV